MNLHEIRCQQKGSTHTYAIRSLGPIREWTRIYVKEFLEASLSGSQSKHKALPTTLLACYLTSHKDKPLGEMFGDSKIWFNHLGSQYGIDIIIPICFGGKSLGPGNTTGILIQVKNNKHFGKKISASGDLFFPMNPLIVG